MYKNTRSILIWNSWRICDVYTNIFQQKTTGVAKGDTRGPWPPCWSVSKKKRERGKEGGKGKRERQGEKGKRNKRKKKKNMFPWDKFIRKRQQQKKKKRVGNWSMPWHKLPLIMVFSVQENAVFIHTNFQNLPTVGGGKTCTPSPPPPPPPLGPFAPSLWHPVDKSWLHHCYWHIGKGHKGPMSRPLIGVKDCFFKGGVGDWYMSLHITCPYNNGIQCARKCRFHIHELSKSRLPNVGGEKPPCHSLPRLVASLPRFGTPLTYLGCTTVTGIAKGPKGPCSPLIGVN